MPAIVQLRLLLSWNIQRDLADVADLRQTHVDNVEYIPVWRGKARRESGIIAVLAFN